jgi:hypothetical protein
MGRLTIYLAKAIGLFIVVLVAALLLRGNAIIVASVADGPVMLVYATISLAMGLAMVLGHNVWSGGALPVIVTLVGWLILAKGAAILFFSMDTMSQMLAQMHYAEHSYLYLLPALALGLYLTWAGFSVEKRRR